MAKTLLNENENQFGFKFLIKNERFMDVAERLKTFMEDEARSCSMDFGCVTPEYVYRMWGGSVAFEEIADAMALIGSPAAQN
ncbi:MAG: hypothetical protein IJP70_07295 [Bacteroidales bacterium]|nr:hypothetical protein [Bacteroidales bacterium]